MKAHRSSLLAVLLVVAVSGASEEAHIKLRADSWFPVNGEPRAARPGFGIEILNAVWSAVGYQIDYQLQPWQRSLDLVHAGKADCVIGAYLTDAPEMLYPLEPLAFDGVSLYALADQALEYRGYDSLAEYRVGVIGGYSYGAEFDTWVSANRSNPNLQIMQGSDALEKNIRKLLSSRLDALVESPLVMQAKLEAMNLEARIIPIASITDVMPIFVACGPGRGARQWLREYDAGISRMRQSGALADIYQRYGIDPVRQDAIWKSWAGRATQ